MELSESINLEKLSKQISTLMETATEKISNLDVAKMGSDFSETNTEIQKFLKDFREHILRLDQV